MDAQLRGAEEYVLDLKKLSDEFNFDIVDVGLNGEVCVTTGTNESLTVHSTIPIGLPPVFPDLKNELEDFLRSPKDLPIQAFQNAQQFWPNNRNIERLYDMQPLPCSTEITMERDPCTGELLGYEETIDKEVGLTAQNSMSLRRKPGPWTNSVKGESTNQPFWPGGIELPELISDEHTDGIGVVGPLEFLQQPLGFEFNVTFDDFKKDDLPYVTSEASQSTIAIADILSSADMDLSSLYIEVPEQPGVNMERESPVDMGLSVNEDLSTELMKVDEESILNNIPVKKEIEEEKKWAVLDDSTDVKDFHRNVPEMAFKFPFELDVFQKRAVLHLERHENVLVAAHTSAGKTVVAEYAVALAQKHMRRAIYTSPIKALSNQKFRDFKHTFPEVGLLTGDVQIKPEAACLIMTTEILRSMLYNGSEVIRDLEWVIFDEIHYINDADRGVVWEEVLIMLPSHIGIILLSATVPNTVEFASWIGKTKQREVYVVQTKKRPVPLEHFLYTGNSNKTADELFCVLDQKNKFRVEAYKRALQAKKDRSSKAGESYGAKGVRQGNPKMDRSVWLSVLKMLQKRDQLPIVAFTLSKKKCDQNADQVKSVDFITPTERSHVITFFNKSLQRLKGTDRQLPQVLWLEELLKNGVGVHHSGILPILKEIVEMLFSRGLVKVLFATETFAMGVNMPARTVVFDSTRKFDGVNFRELLSSEYIQMAGRAGRRGLDSTGMVIILCKGDVPETAELHKMMLGTPTKLASQFRLTYYMILNLLRVKQLTVQDMMKRSFAEYYLQKDAPEHRKKLSQLREKNASLREPQCTTCAEDLKAYYVVWAEVFQLKKQVKELTFSSSQCQKMMAPGRLVLVSTEEHNRALGVILQSGGLGAQSKFVVPSAQSKDVLARLYTVLVLCDKEHEQARLLDQPYRSKATASLFVPVGVCCQVVEEVLLAHVDEVLMRTLKVDFHRIVDNHKKRLISRFRFDPPSQSTMLALQQLLNFCYDFAESECPVANPVKDFNLNNFDFVEKYKRLEHLQSKLSAYTCLQCSDFHEHFSSMRACMQVREDVSVLEMRLSDDNLDLMQEYKQRVEVLKELQYVNKELSLQHKGRVAVEINTHEMMITELLINNLLTDLEPEEIVALLSCFVFEQKKTSPPTLTKKLQEVVNVVKSTAGRVAECQHANGLNVTVEECLEHLHFGLVEVVYEWARGMPFKDVMSLTDVSEGNIVRCIQRLDETCRDVRKAAHVIGVQILCDKMEKGMSLMRRDIVFAASLYTS